MATTEGTFLQRMGSAMREKEAVEQALARLSARLNEAAIPYAVIGGIALAAHGFYRFTTDVDVLTSREGLDSIHQLLVGRGYVPAFPGARKRLRDTVSNVIVEFITAGEYPGDGKPKPVVFPSPDDVAVDFDGVHVISLPKLIELKLASGMTASNRMKDLVDVETLIARAKPSRALGEELDASVRDEYYRMWDAAQTAWDPFAETDETKR
jgi:hypothetical protein